MRTYDEETSFNVQAVDTRNRRGAMRLDDTSITDEQTWTQSQASEYPDHPRGCLLYTSDAADE